MVCQPAVKASMRSACHSALRTRCSALISRYLAFLADFLFVTFVGLCENSGCIPHFLTAPFPLLTRTLPVQNMRFAQCSYGSLPVLPVQHQGAWGPDQLTPLDGGTGSRQAIVTYGAARSWWSMRRFRRTMRSLVMFNASCKRHKLRAVPSRR